MTDTYSPKFDWPVKLRIHNRAPVPYAYRIDPENDLVLLPNWEVIQLIEEGLEYVDKGSSYREVADWLESRTGKKVSHQAVANWWNKFYKGDKESERAREQRRERRKKGPKTAKEKAELAAKRKLTGAKRALTVRQRKLEAFKEEEPEIEVITEGGYTPPTETDPLAGKNIIFQPNAGPQTDFLAASEQEVLYGGAAGGGKSYALLADPMRYFHNPNFNGIIFRRTNDELRELKFKAQDLYKKAFPGTQWREKDSTFVFPSGARLWFTYLERDDDVLRYQGLAFSYIAFDELTQYPTPFAFDYMRSRLRTTDPSLPLYMRATTNPGGPGHGWVKRMFIDPAPPNQAFDATNIDNNEILRWPDVGMDGKPHPKAGQPLFQRKFIPARLSDNPYLYADGQYEANLLSQSEMKRRQLLEGDWTVADGAAFPEFRMSLHVIDPFEIPKNWRRFRSCDYGYSSYSAVHWYAIDPSYDTLIVYRELYVSKATGEALAELILEAEAGENIAYGVLDSSVWRKTGQNGPSVAEAMIGKGVRWREADRNAGSRVNGRNRLHELLKVDEITNIPGILFFNTCRQIISDLPVIPTDPDGGDDIDDRYTSDHAYDSIRYGIMSRPKAATPFDFGSFSRPIYTPADKRFGY